MAKPAVEIEDLLRGQLDHDGRARLRAWVAQDPEHAAELCLQCLVHNELSDWFTADRKQPRLNGHSREA